jgi:hypothetical protein
MKPATIALMIVRLTGVIQLILGMLTWMTEADYLIPYHMTIGSILAIALLFLSYLGFRAGVSKGLVGLVLVWALFLPVWGMIQQALLPEPDPNHWVIQVIHLLCGIGAIGLAEMLGPKLAKKGALPA